MSACSWHQICPQDILWGRRKGKKNKKKTWLKIMKHEHRFTLVSAYTVLQHIMYVIMSRSRCRCRFGCGVWVLSPLSQCAPVQPRPQVQLPLAESHTPPLLQLQRWTQSAPNQPGGQPEGRKHTLKLTWGKHSASLSKHTHTRWQIQSAFFFWIMPLADIRACFHPLRVVCCSSFLCMRKTTLTWKLTNVINHGAFKVLKTLMETCTEEPMNYQKAPAQRSQMKQRCLLSHVTSDVGVRTTSITLL